VGSVGLDKLVQKSSPDGNFGVSKTVVFSRRNTLSSKTSAKLQLEGLGRRRFEIDFSAGRVSSDGGGVLLREADRRLRLSERLASCFTDHRKPWLIDHTVAELVAQRVLALALGYEDLNDHEELSKDPLLAALVGKADPTGEHRLQSQGQPLASASTLGRLERTKEDATAASRYEKIVIDFDAVEDLFLTVFIESYAGWEPKRIIIDLDPSDVALHGRQEERFFHGYYGHYCYLPMYAYCGEYPLSVQLRPSNIDGAAGAKDLFERIVKKLRRVWPNTHIILRADSNFCRDGLLAWCEETEGVDYVIGVAKNSRLKSALGKHMERARRAYLRTGEPARYFADLRYRTLKTWTRARRVVGKAEHLAKGENPRFVVTSLAASEFEKRYLYEDLYCARGEMENRIKEQQLDLFGDRASCHTFRGNAIRLWLSMAAHLLIVTVRKVGLAGTELASAQAGTLRTRLFKIGALVSVSVRRLYVRLSSAFPRKRLLTLALARLGGPSG